MKIMAKFIAALWLLFICLVGIIWCFLIVYYNAGAAGVLILLGITFLVGSIVASAIVLGKDDSD